MEWALLRHPLEEAHSAHRGIANPRARATESAAAEEPPTDQTCRTESHQAAAR